MKPYLFDTPLLPEGFRFPQEYLDVVGANAWPDIAPWTSLAADMPTSLMYYGDMLAKYPERPLVPFAMARDAAGAFNGGWVVLACFDGADLDGQPTVRIFDFGRPKKTPWENLSFDGFRQWLSAATVESQRFKAELDDGD